MKLYENFTASTIKNNKIVCFLLLLLFTINPAIGTFIAFIYLLFSNGNKIPLHFLSFIFSLYLGILNSLKQRDVGDTVSFLLDFKRSSYMSYWEFIYEMYEEPLYSSLIWLTNRIFFENFGIFCLINSYLFYQILGISVIKLGKLKNFSSHHYKLAFILLFFFPFIFTWSFHLTRQVLGFALFVWFLMDYMYNLKFRFVLIIASFLTHTSIILYTPFILYLIFLKKYSYKISVLISSVFFGIIFFGYSAIVSAIPYFSKINSRFEARGFDDGMNINPTIFLLLIFIALVSAIYWFRTKHNKLLLSIFIFTILVSIFSAENFPLISYRFTVNFFILTPFVAFYFIKDNFIYKPIVFMLSSFIFLWFNYYLFNGPWDYGSYEDIYLNNFFNNFYGLLN